MNAAATALLLVALGLPGFAQTTKLRRGLWMKDPNTP